MRERTAERGRRARAILLAMLAFSARALLGSSRDLHVLEASSSAPDVRARLEQMIASSGAEAVAIAYYDSATGEEILIRADEPFHAASTMKVPVMMEVFRQAREGRLSLDDRLLVTNEFVSLADGRPFSLDPRADSDPALYEKIGQEVTIRDLVRTMIVRSSNLATNLLIARVTAARVQALVDELGAGGMRVLRGVEDRRAFERGMNNTTTARALLLLLRRLAEGRAVSPESDAEMVRLLCDEEFREGLPAGVPPQVRIAHKTGAIARIAHDAGIIYPPLGPPYVLVVLTRGFDDDRRARRLIAEISALLYEETMRRRTARSP